MRSRLPLFALVFTLGSLALPFLAHAGVPYFGPIIPGGNSSVCPAGWGMLILVINNLISFLLTIAIVFIAPLMIAYAGFLFVVNPVNSGGIEHAKSILLNTIVGIVIALAGYLIVDSVMAVLYNGSAGAWAQIINWNGATCLPQAGALPGDMLNQAPPGTLSTNGSLNGPPTGKVGTACDPSVVLAGASQGGYTLTAAQANTLACIAQPESACGAPHDPPNYSWNKLNSDGKASTAAGAFQVLLSTNHSCYENSACYGAAGVTGSLNCQTGFNSNGTPKTDSAGAAVVQACLRAASNINCSAAAAACLVAQNNGSFSAWQADVNSARQTGCITGT
jgi:hypothetical protein